MSRLNLSHLGLIFTVAIGFLLVPSMAFAEEGLPILAPATATPSYSVKTPYGPDGQTRTYTFVGIKTTLEAKVTDNGGTPVEKCQYSVNSGTSWTNFNPTIDKQSGAATCKTGLSVPTSGATILNVRACNKAGCKESPEWIYSKVEKDFPKLTKAIGDGKSPANRDFGLTFSKQLSDECKAKIEAALQAAADHPFADFDWIMTKTGDETIIQMLRMAPNEVSGTTLYGKVYVDLVDRVGNTTKRVLIVNSVDYVDPSQLPTLAPATATPSYTVKTPYGPDGQTRTYTIVGLKTNLEAKVTNNGNSPIKKCQYSLDMGKTWRDFNPIVDKTSGATKCVAANLSVPATGAPVLNVRACNQAGCKESPTWIDAKIEKDFPKLTKVMGDGKTPVSWGGLTFTKQLSDDCRAKIEAALQAAADHPFADFDWIMTSGANGTLIQMLLATPNSVEETLLYGKVYVDLVDRVGNTTKRVLIVNSVDYVDPSQLPTLAPATATPSYTVKTPYGPDGQTRTYTIVGLKTNLEAKITNQGSSPVTRCEYSMDMGKTWRGTITFRFKNQAGAQPARGFEDCTFKNITVPATGVPILNVRACNKAGCRESPTWIDAKIEKDFPKLTKGLGDGKTSVSGGESIIFSKQLSEECKAQIEATLQAAVDHPFAGFDWIMTSGANGTFIQILRMAPNEMVPTTYIKDVVVDLVDRVGNTTKNVKIVDTLP